MYYVAETGALVADGVIQPTQAQEIERRARVAMVALVINSLLIGGIVAAALGLVFWLADAMSVAVVGGLSAVAGVVVLRMGSDLYRMFGNAAALIGAGMLASGAGLELADKYPAIATGAMLIAGAVLAGLAAWGVVKGGAKLRFASGAIMLMGLALHVGGLFYGVGEGDLAALPVPLLHLYCAALVIGAGWLLDVRLVTALAIVPLAQVFETGTFYSNGMYAFYSPESTLSILQMAVVIGLCLLVARRNGPVVQRQAGVLAVMAFIVLNLCFLVGSLWGDVIGQSIWGPGWYDRDEYADYDAYRVARDAFKASTLVISANVYAVIWAVFLAVVTIWAAFSNRRGLFNAGMTFAGIHAYTQMFESFGDEPLAYVIGGLAAVPLAWGLWRLDAKLWGEGEPAPTD